MVPDKRGLITGVIVSALGFGGLVFTPVASALINEVGVLETFKWLALIFLCVTVVCGLIIKNPQKPCTQRLDTSRKERCRQHAAFSVA